MAAGERVSVTTPPLVSEKKERERVEREREKLKRRRDISHVCSRVVSFIREISRRRARTFPSNFEPRAATAEESVNRAFKAELFHNDDLS